MVSETVQAGVLRTSEVRKTRARLNKIVRRVGGASSLEHRAPKGRRRGLEQLYDGPIRIQVSWRSSLGIHIPDSE